MKTKTNVSPKFINLEKTLKADPTKPKSFRPMRSMVAVRSLKPKTHVVAFETKTESVLEAH